MNKRLRALALTSATRGAETHNTSTPQFGCQAVSHLRVGNRTVWIALLAAYHCHVGVIQNLYNPNIPDSV
ncbi:MULTISPECIES: hypothetical protein [unclassified Thioalkalivibrio]|uniref:hypothetical protein n=1 Tax=unclassified Thioalkalivibrio TaxID=2621013 RepID=UPI0012DDC6D7|nr:MULTISPECIES: hypothetical protein [unclassified Thioalkalivibrio]